MKKLSLSILALCIAILAYAQEKPLDFGLETRASYTAGGPFSIDYFAIYAKGDIGSGFSYYFYGYPNRLISKSTFFDALSWGMLSYSTSSNWKIQMGKLMIECAGVEYDYKPIDVFSGAEYWQNIDSFQLGVTGQYITDNGDKFSLQVSESPFSGHSAEDTFYAFSASARGSRDKFGYSASFNLMQFAPVRFLAQEIISGWACFGPVRLELDLINRSDANHFLFFKDFSIISQAYVNLGKGVQLFAKYSRDRNASGENYDYLVRDGDDFSKITGGLLWRPEALGGKVRFHLYYSSLNASESAVNCGVTWDIKFIKR